MSPLDADTRTPVPAAALVATRLALHAVAEQVLAGALHRYTGRIGLRATPGGFGTPPFAGPGGVRRIRVDGAELVVEADAGDRRAPLTTVAAAAELVGIEPGGPVGVYELATPVAFEAGLAVDPAAAELLAAVFAVGDAALGTVLADRAADGPGAVQLWPEHFDLGATVGRVNLGVSPGDDGHALPYLYVGPWDAEAREGTEWNEPFGRSQPAVPVPDAAAARAFFETGLADAAAGATAPPR